MRHGVPVSAATEPFINAHLLKAMKEIRELQADKYKMRRELSELKAAVDRLSNPAPPSLTPDDVRSLYRRLTLLESWSGVDGELDRVSDVHTNRLDAIEAQLDVLLTWAYHGTHGPGPLS